MAMVGLLAACGGGSDGESCGDFTACGGNLVGDWSPQAACGTAKLISPVCSGITVNFDHVTITGTESFTASNTFTEDVSTAGSLVLHWPTSCLTINNVTVTCDQLNTEVMTGMGMDDTIERITCAAEKPGCACTAITKPTKDTSSGTYKIDGNTLTVTASTGESATYDYCVSGSNLRWRPSAGATMTPDFNFQINEVLTRK
jgi:hypothetical protein